MKCEDCVSIAQAEWRGFIKFIFMVLGDWGTTPTSKKCILCVQMHCLPISEMSNVGADIAKKSVI